MSSYADWSKLNSLIAVSIIASSNVKSRPKEIINNLESAYNVYSDEYSNSLECSNAKHDVF